MDTHHNLLDRGVILLILLLFRDLLSLCSYWLRHQYPANLRTFDFCTSWLELYLFKKTFREYLFYQLHHKVDACKEKQEAGNSICKRKHETVNNFEKM